MKYFQHITIITCILLISCRRDSPTTTSAASLSFTANGINYSVSGTNSSLSLVRYVVTKPPVYPDDIAASCYNLVATQQTAYVIALVLQTNDKLAQTAYMTTRTNYSTAELTVFNELVGATRNSYAHKNTGDYMAVTVTNITNGLASGTFTAQMSLSYTAPTHPVLITNGKFDNVKITD